MVTQTTDALFSFRISNDEVPTILEYTHPVPTFLCVPTPSQKSSPEFSEKSLDVFSIICAQHHEEILSKITGPCELCGRKAKDCLKSPISYLYLAQPMVVIHVTNTCDSKSCQVAGNAKWAETQKNVMEEVMHPDNSIYKAMQCAVCKKADAKRCVACGKVAYCSKACQKEGWRGHKKHCYGRNPSKPRPQMNLPYESI